MSRRSAAFVSILTLAALITGCSRPDDAPDAAISETVPVARLGSTVVPERYHIELRVDPREERFSGATSIDLRLNAAVDGTPESWSRIPVLRKCSCGPFAGDPCDAPPRIVFIANG